jgi:hypothetical protein
VFGCRDVDEDTKLRLMQQHRRELEALEEATLAEQFRQKQRLRGRLGLSFAWLTSSFFFC